MSRVISKGAYDDIVARLTAPQSVGRVPFSVRFPSLTPAILFTRRLGTSVRQLYRRDLACRMSETLLPHRLYRHASLLMRKLGTSEMRLQRNKVKNLEAAISRISGVVVYPGEVFSLWTLVGKPTRRKGYVDGMLLSRGRIIEGLGGGLCQLSNLLHWMFLHGPFEIIERYHHSLDVFPDSGRTIPFGSGATILYNFVDLKARNTSEAPIQIHLWMTEQKLCGELRTTDPHLDAYRVKETDHCFVHWKNGWYRYNRLWRVSNMRNRKRVSQLAVTNFAPVLYDVDEEALRRNGSPVVTIA